MRCDRERTFHSSNRVTRTGFLCLGALREVLLINLAAGIVLGVLWQAQAVFKSQLQPDLTSNLSYRFPSVLDLDFDQDRQMLLVHSLRGEFEQIDVETGVISKRQRPQNLISAATSETNSTSIMLSQWSTSVEYMHQIYIVRDQELLLSEKVEFLLSSSGDARISADGQVAVVVGHEGLVLGWDLSSAEPTRWQFQLTVSALSSRLSADGTNLLIVSNDGDPSIFDARTGVLQFSLPRIHESNRSIAWSQDGRRIALGDQNGGLHVFDGITGTVVWNHKLDFLFARCLTLSSDGKLLAVGGFDKRIRVWDLSQPTAPPTILTGETGVVHNFVFTASDTRLISGGTDGTIREWSLESRELIRQFR